MVSFVTYNGGGGGGSQPKYSMHLKPRKLYNTTTTIMHMKWHLPKAQPAVKVFDSKKQIWHMLFSSKDTTAANKLQKYSELADVQVFDGKTQM